jgi:hypothetical protein
MILSGLATIAIITLDIIAIIAMVFARRASDRAFSAIELASIEASIALREIDKLISSRVSARSEVTKARLSSNNFSHDEALS